MSESYLIMPFLVQVLFKKLLFIKNTAYKIIVYIIICWNQTLCVYYYCVYNLNANLLPMENFFFCLSRMIKICF